jgi:quinol monooxygenase YgiN
VLRFDVVQNKDEANRFVLVEVYADEHAPAKHKETAHYQTWRDAVAEMMAEPRKSQKFDSLYPEQRRWQTPA